MISTTDPDRVIATQQAWSLAGGGQQPQGRSRFAEPFIGTFTEIKTEQPDQDQSALATTTPNRPVQAQRTATALNDNPVLENGKETISSTLSRDSSPFKAIATQIDRSSNDTDTLSLSIRQKEALPSPPNIPSIVESNAPATSGGAPTLANTSSTSPTRATDAPTTTSTFTPTLPETLDLRQNNWGRALGHQLNWLVNNRMQEAEIRVNPPELGPLEVRMSLHQNQTNVTFFCHDAAVREAIENALPRLREMLDSQGIHLNHTQVSDQSLARQQTGSGGQSAYHPRDDQSSFTHSDPESSPKETTQRPRPSLPGTVDDYA
ncbi:MAG: flagellar hook-length control protein FliK [Gammaproteobacteria bacterium]|nr:flagellar hook-length control protein FliK [Gammaproteobacteria bacterium]